MDPGRKSIDAGSVVNKQQLLHPQSNKQTPHHHNHHLDHHQDDPSSHPEPSCETFSQQQQAQNNRNADVRIRGCQNLMIMSAESEKMKADQENHNVPAILFSSAADQRTYEHDPDYSCGLLSCRPAWLQSLAQKEVFLIIFSLTSVLQGMYFTYFVSVLTTIEKLYQMPSRTTGVIMSATEIGQIGGALLLTYYGGQGHRPKWIAAGMLVFAAACLLCATPHFLFGGQSVLSSHVSSFSQSSASQSSFAQSLCRQINQTLDDEEKCSDTELRSSQSKVTTAVLSIFFVSLFLIGIGATAVNTLGIPYIDDNVAPRQSPLYFGITIGVKIFGPVFGFLLGSLCTTIHVDFPFESGSGLAPSDPQWISAWWLGVLIVGLSLILTAIPMLAFPKKLSAPDPSSYCHRQQQLLQQQHEKARDGKETEVMEADSHRPTLKNFPAAVKRLLCNKLLLLRTASSVLHILPIAGLYTFLPKYLESQFQLTASKANMISGVAGILVMGFGIFASGVFMRTFKPKARFVAAWIAATALLYCIGMVILMFLGCEQQSSAFAGLMNLREADSQSLSVPHATCSTQCSCPSGQFSPICTSEGITYLSPCLAGCSTAIINSTTYQFSSCACLQPDVSAVNGYCSFQCNDMLMWYILIFSCFVLIHSTSEVGSMLLTLRCVQPQDKAMALGLVSFSIGLFGNVPCPIVYGAVVDSACLFWEKTCGEAGACRLYDADRFRFAFHGITAGIMFVAFVVDLCVCSMASHVQFHDEDETDEDEADDLRAKQKTDDDVSLVASDAAVTVTVKLKSESSV